MQFLFLVQQIWHAEAGRVQGINHFVRNYRSQTMSDFFFFRSQNRSDFFLELYLPLPLYPQKFIENHIISMENGVEMGPGGHLGAQNSQEEKNAKKRLDLVWI